MNRRTSLFILIAIGITSCTYDIKHSEKAGDYVIETVSVNQRRILWPAEHLDTYYNIYEEHDDEIDFDDLAARYIMDQTLDNVKVMDVRPFLTMDGPLYCVLESEQADTSIYWLAVLVKRAQNESALVPLFSFNQIDERSAWLYQMDSLYDHHVIFGSYIFNEETMAVEKQLPDLKYCYYVHGQDVHNPNNPDSVEVCDYLHGVYAVSPDNNFVVRSHNYDNLSSNDYPNQFFITDLNTGETYRQPINLQSAFQNYKYGYETNQGWFERNFRLVPGNERHRWIIEAVSAEL